MDSSTTALEEDMFLDEISTTPQPRIGQPPALRRLVTVGNVPDPSGPTLNIVEIYRQLLDSDAALAMPIAAIESLIEVLANSDETTVSGTLNILQEQADFLKAQVPNAISLTAGCDLFMRYIVVSFRSGNASMEETKNHLLRNAHKFVERAKAARARIAHNGRFFIRNGATVLTHGGSRCVGALLLRAAAPDAGPQGELLNFRVIYVTSDGRADESRTIIDGLRAQGIPVSTISEAAVGYCMSEVDAVFVGAEGVVENGGIVSRIGTYQIGVLAQAANKPMYVAAETCKFVRIFPLRQKDLPVQQQVLEFKTAADLATDATARLATDYFDDHAAPSPIASDLSDAVDYTPPKYIKAIITEDGPLTTAAVSDALITIYA